MPILHNKDVDLYYEIHGEGAPLMLVAGLASDSQSWLPVVDALTSQYQLILLDNRGVGRTEPKDIEISIGAMADDCIALARHLNVSSFSLLGHSMGDLLRWIVPFVIRTVSQNSLLLRHPRIRYNEISFFSRIGLSL